MKNTLKTMIGLTALFTVSIASAKCIVDGDYLDAMARYETPPNINCNVEGFVMDNSLSDSFSTDSIYIIQLYGQKELQTLDLTNLDAGLQYSVDVGQSENIQEIKIGNIEKFTEFNLRETKIHNLKFLENITQANIFIDQKITRFPDKSSPFCENVRINKIEMTPENNSKLMKEACKIEEQ